MDFNERIKTVIPMLETKGLYGTVTLIRDLKKEVDNNQQIRNEAITEFAERIALEISESIIYGMLFDNRDNSSYDTADKIVDYVIDTSKKIAEEMREGGE